MSISSWLGGPGTSLATVLANLPADVDPVLASPVGGDLLSRVAGTSRLAGHLPIARRPGPAPDPVSRIRAAARLTRWIFQHRRDLLCIHANGSSELHLTALAARLAGVPLVVWFHGSEVGTWDRRLGPIWKSLLPLRRQAAVSSVAATVAAEMGIARIDEVLVIPNPIDPRQCRALRPCPGPEREEPNDVVVGFLGGTSRPEKGARNLPQIVESTSQHRVRWLIFDERPDGGPDQSLWDRLDEVGGDRVVAAGRARDVRVAYAQCDVVLCPSLKESFSRIAVEAMMNGLPVVASDIPAHRALLGDGKAGFLFPLNHPEEAGAAIARLARDPVLRATLGSAGLIKARQFEPGPIVSRLVGLYEDAAAARR